MGLYLILFIINIAVIIAAKRNVAYNKICAFLLLSFMCTLCACRDLYCGRDTLNYYNIYTEDPDNILREPLYVLSMLCIPDFRLFLIFYCIPIYYITYYCLSKEVKLCCIGLLVYMISPSKFFPESFNIIRQSLSGALILWAFTEMRAKRKTRAIILILIACGFHFSSIVAFPFLFLSRIKLKQVPVLISIMASFLIGLMFSSGSLMKFIGNNIGGLGGDVFQLISLKILSYSDNFGTASFSYNLTLTIPLTLACIFCYPLSKRAKIQYRYYYNIFFVTTLIANVVIPAIAYGFRFVYSLEYIQMLVIPNAYLYGTKRQKICIIIVLILFTLLYFHYLLNLPSNSDRTIVPYKAFFM